MSHFALHVVNRTSLVVDGETPDREAAGGLLNGDEAMRHSAPTVTASQLTHAGNGRHPAFAHGAPTLVWIFTNRGVQPEFRPAASRR